MSFIFIVLSVVKTHYLSTVVIFVVYIVVIGGVPSHHGCQHMGKYPFLYKERKVSRFIVIGLK